MKIALYILLVVSPIIGLAQTATEGGYIVVRGALKDCRAWDHRILDAVKIENQTPLTILEIPGISLVGLSRGQIENELSDAIIAITGKRPDTLTVEILASDTDYQVIVKEHLASLKMLVEGKCPRQKAEGNEPIQEELERVRLLDISKRIAYTEMYNKSLNTEASKAGSS